MATYTGYSPVDFARAQATTLAKHIRELEDACTRNFPALAQIEANGRITYNNGGRGFDWPVQYRIHNVEGNTGETQRNFVRRNLFKLAAQEYRGYQAVDAMYQREFLENRGEEGIVKVFDQFIERLTRSIRQVLGKEVYTDGSATNNEKFWHGFDSMFGNNGTIHVTAGTQRSKNAADPVAYPSDTYATLSTVLSTAGGGEWESGQVWPEGDGDPEYDFWSPLIIQYNSSAFASMDESLRYGIIHTQKNATLDEQLTTGIMSRTLYYTLLNVIDNKETINVNRGEPNSLTSLGFKNTLVYDGVEFTFDSAISGNKGYAYNWRNVELKCCDSMMLKPEGPEYDIHTQAYNAVVSTLSNFKFSSPRNFVCWKALADLS